MEEAKRVRAGCKGWLSRSAHSLKEELAKSPSNKIAIQGALEDLNTRLSKFDEAQDKVEIQLTEEQLIADIDDTSAYRSEILSTKWKAEGILNEIDENSKKNSETEVYEVSVDGNKQAETEKEKKNHAGASPLGRSVNLPKLELPKFGGNVLEWPSFWEKFEATVDSENISKVTKFAYLQTLLEGEAKACIDGLSVTAVDYKTACELLQKRFGRKDQIIFAHIQALLNIPVPTVEQGALRRILDQLTTHIRSLESLGVGGDNYGIVLTPILLSRLPQQTRMEWARLGENKEGDLKWLLRFLEKEIEARERAAAYTSQQDFDNDNVTKEERRRRKSSATALHVAAAEQKTYGLPVCDVCGKGHKTWRCWSLTKAPLDERKKIVKEKGLCFACLQKGHRADTCAFRCSRCNGKHNQLCCGQATVVTQGNSASTSLQSGDNYSQSHIMHVAHQADGPVSSHSSDISYVNAHLNVTHVDQCSVMLQTVKVKVYGQGGKSCFATLLFDSGADRSYISSSLVKKVSAQCVGSKRGRFVSFGGSKSGPILQNIFEIQVSGSRLLHDRHKVTVTEIPTITVPLQRPRVPAHVLQSYDHLTIAEIGVDDGGLSTIDILIGLDSYWDLMKASVIRLSEGLVLQDSVFGYVMSGRFSGVDDELPTCQLFTVNESIDSSIRRLWNLEGVGINPKEDEDIDQGMLTTFGESINFSRDHERYEVGLLWKENGVIPSNNRVQAEVRLKSLQRRLTPEVKAQYGAVFTEMENEGMIEEVRGQDDCSRPEYYLPHRPVIRETSETTKIRPVFDASAVSPNGSSLNDCLHKGPNLIPNIVDVLLRFRRWRVALAGDISKAFLQISMRTEDRDFQRFLLSGERENSYRVMRFTRVTFGINCSPFLLSATIKHHLTHYDSHVANELEDNFYVDDWLSGADCESEAIKMFAEAKKIMSDAGMCLSKWTSNSVPVQDYVVEEGSGLRKQDGTQKLLGIAWEPECDAFVFDGLTVGEVVVTKRVVLSLIARFFDPIGLVAPVLVSIKLLFQDLWRVGVSWDEVVPEIVEDDVRAWLRDLQHIRGVKIPRCYSTVGWTPLVEVQLHFFADASEKAYGTCCYLQMTKAAGNSEVSLVMSKARLAPLKRLTLPRLELMAALLAARLSVYVRRVLELKSVQCHFWTDSMIVLGWIKGDPARWKPFVANRACEIQDLTDPSDWNHVRGNENPADLLTRGFSARLLLQSPLWWDGPEWLKESRPGECSSQLTYPSDDTEEVGVTLLVSDVQLTEKIFEVERWSSFKKSVRVAAWVMRFINNLRGPSKIKGELLHEELELAKKTLFREVQQLAFPQEWNALSAGKIVSKSSSLRSSDPMLHDGLLRIKGRLQRSGFCFEEAHPIILPKCYLSMLLVRDQHIALHHAGVDTVITSLRTTYCIVSLRRMAKRVKRFCVTCQRFDSAQCEAVQGPLPADRVVQRPPFTVTGIDFAGPFYVSDFPDHKYYMLLFTCAVVRAVHLELCDSMSTEDCLLAFRRFVARRGLPSIVYSDNAKTFVKVSQVFLTHFGDSAPRWKFIVPRAPWWGGWWERLVRTTKSSLKKSIGARCLTRCQLETLLLEVETCVNSRPIVFFGDCVDNKSPLTPSHFLIGRPAGVQSMVTEDQTIPKKDLQIHQSFQLERLNHFWQIWRTAYIKGLPCVVGRLQKKGDLEIGSCVLVREDNVPRLHWPMGVVIELVPGFDDVVRCVKVRTQRGEMMRPVQRLHRLETESNDDNFVLQGDVQLKGVPTRKSGRVIKPPAKLTM